jgi:PAS domain S-box-containing protein
MAYHVDFPACLLDQLPFGILVARGTRIAYLSGFFLQHCGATVANATAFCERNPQLLQHMAALPLDAIVHTTVDGKPYWLKSMPLHQDQRGFLLIPDAFAAALAPGLQALQQQCLDFEEIYHQSFDGIFVTDGEGRAVMVNAGCERNYGIEAKDIVGQHVSVFERDGRIRPVIATRVIAERRRVTVTQQTRAGKKIFATGIPLFDEAGKVRKVIINSRDTTELNQLQEELTRSTAELARVAKELSHLREEQVSLPGLVCHSPVMQAVTDLALRVAKVDTTVLITGESGAGKDVLAQLIHRQSGRVEGPFIKVNCGAIPRDLVESELFGYEGGAFTGALKNGKVGIIERANRGTLFLDEIGELPLDAQVKLLQVLQDRVLVRVGGASSIPVDLRIVAATNRDLRAMVDEKAFRKDLYYRLNVVPISMPPLRQRKEDIEPLIGHYLAEFNQQYRLQKTMSNATLAVLQAYSWPGNVRELRNLVERLVVTTPEDTIDVENLPEEAVPIGAGPMNHRGRVAQFEEDLVTAALHQFGSTRAAARHLGISQSTVVRKLKATGS